MKFIKRSQRRNPRVSLVLLDWSVRESFHLLHYLGTQTAERDDFEVIVIEYYSRISEAIRKFEDQIDIWVVLEMPENCYYHKHLMYNVGIVLSRGEIVMIGDADTMVRETFIQSIIDNFERDPKVVYHIDQFRNMRRDLYPFNFPSFENVLGEGCINNGDGRTTGVLDDKDPIHNRNYGACMCARREDLIAIGGADQHIDYLGHICGPYEMTFRLTNHGRREVWALDEFMYHTWHPGQAGADNYLGPHDGRHMSATALEALTSGRVRPFLENGAIRLLRTGQGKTADEALDKLIDSKFYREWDVEFVERRGSQYRWTDYTMPLGIYKGYRLVSELGYVLAYPITERGEAGVADQEPKPTFEGTNLKQVRKRIDQSTPLLLSAASRLALSFVLLFRLVHVLQRCIRFPFALSLRLVRALQRRIRMLQATVRSGLARFSLTLMASPHHLANKLRRAIRDFISKARMINRDRRELSGHLSSLAVILYNLENSDSMTPDDGPPVALAGDRYTVYFLRALGLFGLIRSIDVRRVADVPDIERCLKELERRGWHGCLVVPGDLYARFHVKIVSSRASERMIIV